LISDLSMSDTQVENGRASARAAGLTAVRNSVGQQSGGRVAALDWVKGALVVFMVVYHALGYSRLVGVSFRYLAFLPASFILIAGFLLTNSYLARYSVGDWRLHRRLVVRGFKLIVLFTVLNLGTVYRSFRGQSDSFAGLAQFAEDWKMVYLSPAGKVVSFTIILSIGYLLLIAPPLFLLRSLNAWLVPALAVGGVFLCSWLEWNEMSNYHVNMVVAGIIGMALGVLSLDSVGRLARRWVIIVPLYLGYRLCSYLWGEPYLLRLVGVCLSLLILYGLALALSPQSVIYQQFVLFGRYSLFGYIFQLGILQILFRIPMTSVPGLNFVIMALITLVLTWSATRIVERLRRTTPIFDWSYKVIFA
jgi:hypothetical protein